MLGRRRRQSAMLLAAAFACAPAVAQEHFGIVTAVRSGERLVLSTAERTIDIVLARVDAPRLEAPLGLKSQTSLTEICHGKAATLIATGAARDGSTIGEVSCGGVSAQEEQVRRGLARVKPPFDTVDSPLVNAQQAARLAARGIWSAGRRPTVGDRR